MRLVFGIAALALLAGCASAPKGPAAPRDGELPTGEQGGARKVGNPYQVAGQWYYPKEEPDYDETGYASWYGPDFHGKATANGEKYNMNALTAAHKTLPLPSFVKVTNLENGRSLVLRVNDRGPFVKNRILDVSRRGAQLLGFDQQGTTKVRVQISDEKGNILYAGRRQAPAIAQPADMQPVPTIEPVAEVAETSLAPAADLPMAPLPATPTQHFIQVGAFANKNSADSLIKRLRTGGHAAQMEPLRTNGITLWRVRIGPFIERLPAERKLDRVLAEGFDGARIFTESSR